MCKKNPSCLNPNPDCECIDNNCEDDEFSYPDPVDKPDPPFPPLIPSSGKFESYSFFENCVCCHSFNRFKYCNQKDESPALPCYIKCKRSRYTKTATKFPCPPLQPHCPIKCHRCNLEHQENERIKHNISNNYEDCHSDDCHSDDSNTDESDCYRNNSNNTNKTVYKIKVKNIPNNLLDDFNLF